MKLPTLAIAGTALMALAQSADAKGAICEHVQADLFSIDGMTDDWQNFEAASYGTGKDAKLELRCAYDEDQLYLLLNVADERLVRSKRAKARAEDRVEILLGVGNAAPIRIQALPGSLRARRRDLLVPSFVQLEDSLQDEGFTMELSIPLRKFRDWSGSVPYLSGKVLYHDVDLPSDGKAQSVIGMKGRMHFGDAVETYRAFMRTTGLRNRDVKLDQLVDADPGAGPERVIVGGKVIGLLGTSFNYMTLPIADAKDLLGARVVDFDGGGRYAILTELRQYGNGGSRDVLIAWFAEGDGSFKPALTIETRKEMAGKEIVNTWSLVPREQHREVEGKRKRGKRAKKKRNAPPGRDLLVQAASATGFTATTYREAPAPDAKSILLPWGNKQSAVYFIDGTVAWGGEPALDLPGS